MSIIDQMSAAVGRRRGVEAADRLCEACVDLLGVDAAAISLIFDGAISGTLGVSSGAARRYDELQFMLGEGPCLQSVADRTTVLVSDLADPAEKRWPLYSPAMTELQVSGVFAVPIAIAGEYAGALDLFRHQAGPMTTEQLSGALAAAQLSQLPLLDLLAEDLQGAADDVDGDTWQTLNALTRIEISQATGMVVGQLDVSPGEALVLLRSHAYAQNRSATEVARDILDRRLRLEL